MSVVFRIFSSKHMKRQSLLCKVVILNEACVGQPDCACMSVEKCWPLVGLELTSEKSALHSLMKILSGRK